MRNARGLFGVVALASFVAAAVSAQSIRGTVVDGSGRPVVGAVLQLVDTASVVSARVLSSERGEFRLVAPRPGTYRIRSLRIGFTPWMSDSYTIASGASLTERITLANVAFGLDTIRIAALNSCKLGVDSGAATFAVWQQARTALLAADLTRAARNIASTTVVHERRLEADGRRTISQKSTVHSEVVKEPWLTIPPAELHHKGYVLQADNFEMTYYAPGIDMLVSDVFVADHCFRLKEEKDRVGIAFEPTRERGDTAEIRGTMWLDKGTSALTSMDFKYVNLPRDFTSDAGGEMEFVRLRNGAWAISRWDIRMGIFERHTRSARFGGPGIHLAEMQTDGGELILATLAKDTLFAQSPRVLRGIVRDSTSNITLGGARVSLLGTSIATVTDDKGRFSLAGVLPGIYSLEVRTASLDSVSAMHRADVEFLGDQAEKEIRVLTGTQIIANVCESGTTSVTEPGVLLGRVHVAGTDSVPGDTKISVQWSVLTAERNGGVGRVAPVRTSREVRVAADGSFRVCGIPANHDLAIEAESDSGYAEPVVAKIPAFGRFARAELTMTRSAAGSATFAGSVLLTDGDVPISDAEVTVYEPNHVSRTDEKGVFRIVGIAPGAHRVTMRKLGYSNLDTTLTFNSGQLLRRQVRLTKVALLAENVTRAMALPPTFEENRRLGLGTFFVRADLEKFEGRPMVSVMSQVRGMHIVFMAPNRGFVTSSRRAQCPPGLPKQFCGADMVPMGSEMRCASQVYLDGVLQNRGNPPEPYDLRQIDASQLEALEWYGSAAETPMEFAGANGNCGTLAMYTRRSSFKRPAP